MKKLLITLLMILGLFVAGCTTGTQAPSSTPFVGGNTGLVMSFVTASPPDEVFDDEQFPFSVIVNVVNRGEYDLESNDGFVRLEGISAQEYGLSESQLEVDIPEIEGARKGIDGSDIEGFQDVVEFPDLNYEPNIAGTLETVIRAVGCYNYETQATANVCIKEDTIDDLRDNEVCEIAGPKDVQNSGAPIQVKSVVESPQSRNGIQVAITLGSVGQTTDSFYKEDTDCDNRRNNPDRDTVFVEVDPLNNGQIRAKCSGLSGGDSGYVKLFDGQDRTITCSFDTSSISSDFETRMNINLRYRYSQFIEKAVIIRDVPGGDDN